MGAGLAAGATSSTDPVCSPAMEGGVAGGSEMRGVQLSSKSLHTGGCKVVVMAKGLMALMPWKGVCHMVSRMYNDQV